MIRSFRHKGLKALYEKDRTKGINPAWLKRIRAILARLEASKEPADMDLPGLRLHPMKGDLRGFWAVDVSGNWRIIFRFEDRDAHDVDLIDYH
jgi:proteic killer suppression protein